MEYKSINFEIKALPSESQSQDWIVEGYASTYDVDLGGDRIEKGAFKNTIQERFTNQRAKNGKSKIKVLWQHKTDILIGSVLELREDDNGLYCKIKVFNDSAFNQAEQAYKLALWGELDSFSIGYKACEHQEDESGIRVISEVKLYELSFVTFPMNEMAEFTSVKDERELMSMNEEIIELLKELKQMIKPATENDSIVIGKLDEKTEGEVLIGGIDLKQLETDVEELKASDCCKSCGDKMKMMCPSCSKKDEEVSLEEKINNLVNAAFEAKLVEFKEEVKSYWESLNVIVLEEKEVETEIVEEKRVPELNLEDFVSLMLTKQITL